MKKVFITLILLLIIPIISKAALTRAPEDFLGRVSIPFGTEVEVLKFKTDQIVYAGTNGAGLYVSYDAGSNWAKLTGFPEEYPCIKDLIITSPNDMYAATFGGGIFYSHDNGATWSAKNDGITNLFTQSVAVTKDGILVCGTYGSGVFYSKNYGVNWARTDEGLRYDNINCIQVMNNGYIVAGSYGGGFYVSRDTCKTWIQTNTQLNNLFINDLAKDLTGKLFAASNGAGVMFTGDGITWLTYSNKWHKPYDKFVISLLDTAVTCVGTNEFQLLMGSRSAGMYYWDDLWNAWTSTGPLAVGITSCSVAPNGTILATRSYGDVIRSTDNGLTWIICTAKIVDIDLEQYNNSPTFLSTFISDYSGSIVSVADSGAKQKLYLSNDHGNTWKLLNSIATTDVFDVEITPDSSIFVADEEGIHKYSKATGTLDLLCDNPSEPNSFYRFQEIEYNPISKTLLAVYQLLEPADPSVPPPDPPWKRLEYRLYKSMNNGLTWTFQSYKDTAINKLNIDANGDLYMNKGGKFSKSVDNGTTFTTLFPMPDGKFNYSSDGNYYYYDTANKIYIMKNKSGTWTQIPFSPEIPVEQNSWFIQSIGANSDSDFYVSIRIQVPNQGFMYELYMTKDQGINWQTEKGCYNMDKIRSINSDNNGYTYLLTNALYKVINPKHLKPPKILVPSDNDMGAEINPVFKWNRAPLAEEYELQIDPTYKFDSPFETNVTGDTTCKAIIDLSFNTNYYWRIRSKTHSAVSAWTIGTFTVGMEPPLLISPEKGKVGVPLNAYLVWHPIVDATHYSIQIAEDVNFDKVVWSKDNHPDTTITSDKLTGLKTYYWRVKAFTEKNTSRWSEVWNFRTVMGPPQLIYPANNAIDRLLSEQLTWRKTDEALTYYIQVAKDPVFSNIFLEGSTATDTFKLVENMLPETDYYWHVRSVNNEGSSEYSDTWKYTTSLKAVTLQTPEKEKVNVPKDVKLTWLEHNGGSLYQIQISKTADFKTTVEDKNVNNILEFQSTKLEYYKTYYWRVRLLVGQRVGLWSETWSFKTGIENTSLLNPPDKSVDQPTSLKFKWNEVFGAPYYQLQISKNTQFTDLVYSMDSIIKAEQYVPDLEPEILYFWRVRAWNPESYGTAQWSNVWTFTTGQVTLILRNPKTGSTDVSIPALLTWYSATTAEYYHLQVSKDVNFGTKAFDKDSIYDTKWTLSKTDLEINTEYYWRVRGDSKQYNTPWSETWRFTTGLISVEESDKFTSIKLYPNPTGSRAELSINYTESCEAILTITTAEGKLVRSEAITLSLGETRYAINTEHFATGSYYISIITPSGVITRELVVIR